MFWPTFDGPGDPSYLGSFVRASEGGSRAEDRRIDTLARKDARAKADELLDGYITGFRVPIAGPSAARELIWSRPAVLESYSYLIGPRSRFVFVTASV